MHQKRSRSSKPKLFQCTGYGDCNMVFTRSEHLARHSRKHTGEKPFVCVVPLCTKAFSRFDNMMQHTQTHRNNNNYNIITNPTKSSNQQKYNSKDGRDTRSSTRQRQQLKDSINSIKKGEEITTAAAETHSCEQQDVIPRKLPTTSSIMNSNLYIQTHSYNNSNNTGLISPVSLSSLSPKRNHSRQHYSSSEEDDDDEDDEYQSHQPITPTVTRRRLSVADLCNPSTSTTNYSSIHLTKDEYEALEGFGRFRYPSSPSSVFFDSLKDLASNVHIEPPY